MGVSRRRLAMKASCPQSQIFISPVVHRGAHQIAANSGQSGPWQLRLIPSVASRRLGDSNREALRQLSTDGLICRIRMPNLSPTLTVSPVAIARPFASSVSGSA